MSAPQGPLHHREGVPIDISYSRAVANESSGAGIKRPTFETPPDLKAQLMDEGTAQDKGTDSDLAKEKSYAKFSAPWIPGKCIP